MLADSVAAATNFDWSVLLNYGLGGLLVIGFLSKVIVPGWLYKDKIKENDRLRGQVETMQDAYTKEIYPALVQSNRVLEKLIVTEVRVPGSPNGGTP